MVILLTNILVQFALFVLMLVHPWRTAQPQPAQPQPQRSIVRKARAADGGIWQWDGTKYHWTIGVRFRVDAFVYRTPTGGEL